MIHSPVMFTVLVGAALCTAICAVPGRRVFGIAVTAWLWLTVLFGTLSEVHRRGPRQGPGGQPPRQPQRRPRPGSGSRTAPPGTVPGTDLRRNDVVICEAGDVIPSDGEIIEGLASVDESDHHRRIGPGHPRIRRRPLLRHRRHQGPLGPDRHPHHRRAGPDVHRPDDQARRRRRAAEDPQRNRPARAAGLPDHRVPGRHHVPGPVRRPRRRDPVPDRARRPAGLPDPHHHRRARPGHRHRRHGPPGPAQRPGHLRPRRGNRRGHHHAAARQDRHHHLRQPPRRQLLPRQRAWTGPSSSRRPGCQPGRRNPRGPLHRGPRRRTRRYGPGTRLARPAAARSLRRRRIQRQHPHERPGP